MNLCTFYLVDDERAPRNILTEIIEEENLGEVIGYGEDGAGQELAIMKASPQVVLLDLLMPEVDGISLAAKLRSLGFSGRIVMISQVEDKEMVARAYKSGVEFYITKPINRIEVLAVLRQLLTINSIQQSLEQALHHQQSLSWIESSAEAAAQSNRDSLEAFRSSLNQVLYQLGIIGESGANDIIQVVLYLYLQNNQGLTTLDANLNLQQLYREVISHIKEGGDVKVEEVKAMEQRLRRTIKNCFDNLAAIGLIDYADPRFERYAGNLFDYKEIRQRMDELQNNEEASKARINIKKFIQAILMEATIQ